MIGQHSGTQYLLSWLLVELQENRIGGIGVYIAVKECIA
jgi:hypothetical protein